MKIVWYFVHMLHILQLMTDKKIIVCGLSSDPNANFKVKDQNYNYIQQ